MIQKTIKVNKAIAAESLYGTLKTTYRDKSFRNHVGDTTNALPKNLNGLFVSPFTEEAFISR